MAPRKCETLSGANHSVKDQPGFHDEIPAVVSN
jgi:hypothetical protein